MALIQGKIANIIWDGQVSKTQLKHGQSWTLDVTHTVDEVTSMQDTWKTYLSGHQDWTATVECLLDSAGPEIGLGGPDGLADDTVYLELWVIYDAGDYKGFYGNAICTGISPSNPVDGIATVTYTFQGKGQILWYDNVTVP